jgi:hypothetical protein
MFDENTNFETFQKANRSYTLKQSKNIEDAAIKLNDEFIKACMKLAKELHLKQKYKGVFDGFEFMDKYARIINYKRFPWKMAMEKYVLDTIYGEKKMNNKMNFKYGLHPMAKAEQLKNIKQNMDTGANSITWSKVTDPDYYDLRELMTKHGKMEEYYKSLIPRIKNYENQSKSKRISPVNKIVMNKFKNYLSNVQNGK